MREFFRGWRRKLGYVALVMAICMLGAWARSRTIIDTIEIRPNPTSVFSARFALESMTFELSWEEIHTGDRLLEIPKAVFNWASCEIHGSPPQDLLPAYRRARYFAAASHSLGTSTGAVATLSMPYATSVLSMSWLSAYLILWKPRQRTGSDHA